MGLHLFDTNLSATETDGFFKPRFLCIEWKLPKHHRAATHQETVDWEH